MRVKICCMQSIEEARLAVSSGAHAIGFVSETLGGNRALPDDEIRKIVETTPPSVATVLLTCAEDPGAIARHQRSVRANTLQLSGEIHPEGVRALREALPGIGLVKVVHVQDASSIDDALRFADVADAILLDTKVVRRDGPALGGTGMTHDWSISRRIVQSCPCPVILAGGLSPENVARAIEAVGPFGVDVCSSLRPDGSLDPGRARGFVARAVAAARATERESESGSIV